MCGETPRGCRPNCTPGPPLECGQEGAGRFRNTRTDLHLVQPTGMDRRVNEDQVPVEPRPLSAFRWLPGTATLRRHFWRRFTWSSSTCGPKLVERSPEKAGVGGSIPSLATTFSSTYKPQKSGFGSNWFQFRLTGIVSHLRIGSIPLGQGVRFVRALRGLAAG